MDGDNKIFVAFVTKSMYFYQLDTGFEQNFTILTKSTFAGSYDRCS